MMTLKSGGIRLFLFALLTVLAVSAFGCSSDPSLVDLTGSWQPVTVDGEPFDGRPLTLVFKVDESKKTIAFSSSEGKDAQFVYTVKDKEYELFIDGEKIGIIAFDSKDDIKLTDLEGSSKRVMHLKRVK